MPQQTGPDWRELRVPGFIGHMGPLLAAREDGAWRYGLRTTPHHANPVGLVHGGVITTLIDHAMALVAWEATDRQPAVTIQLDSRFVGAARVGDLLEVRATLRHMTGSLLFMDAEVGLPERTVATASAILKRTNRSLEETP